MKIHICLLSVLATIVSLSTPASERTCKPGSEGFDCRAGVKAESRKQVIGSDGTIKIKRRMKLPPQLVEHPNSCDADLGISSTQMNDRIRIKARIVNKDCAASSGDYTLRILTMNEEGETHLREFPESWSRQNDAPIELTQYFGMESDVDLIWVRVRTSSQTACTCNDEPAASSEDT